jgi:ParB-like chromosome segregation protein Spo0J
MGRKSVGSDVKSGFEDTGIKISISDIRPLRTVTAATKATVKYAKIAASIREIGIVEPPIVARLHDDTNAFLLLDGHLRIEALKHRGDTQVMCLVSTDDEAYTYNKRVNRLAIIQEHRMILKAIERGLPEARIARALNINVSSIRGKKRLLEGICPEVAEMFKDRYIATHTFTELKKMSAMRQIEVAEVMIAMNKFTARYARSLLLATPQSQLIEPTKAKKARGLTEEQIALMERESGGLEREFKIAEQSYGTDHLDLVLTNGYVSKLLANARIVRYLSQHHREIFAELQKLVEPERTTPQT